MMLRVENVKKAFGGIKALDGCELKIKKNSITAIIGPNGSGKSTLFNVISQLYEIDNGKIYLDNELISDKKDFEVARLGISRTFQDVRLFNYLTIQDHMEIAMSPTDECLFCNLFKRKYKNLTRIEEILELVQLKKPLNTLATDLSYGQRKLLDLAIAIAKPHSLLMLDEPVAGVNPALRMQIKDLIKVLNRERGETILLIEHDMNFVMDLVDYIFVMDTGYVIAEGLPKEIQNNQDVLDAYLGS